MDDTLMKNYSPKQATVKAARITDVVCILEGGGTHSIGIAEDSIALGIGNLPRNGDYLVERDGGTSIVPKEEFEGGFEPKA